MKKYLGVIKLFVTWRVILFAFSLFIVPLSRSFEIFSNFDGIRFLNIAKEGYGTPHTFYSYSLFPLFPLLIHSLSSVFGGLVSGLLVSHIFTVASLFVFKKLAELDYSKEITKNAVVYFLIFPSSFFLVSVYSESLFLFLCLLSVLFMRQKKYLLSAIVALFASYTRMSGIFLWVMLLIEYYNNHKDNFKNFLKPSTLFLLIPPLGALYYLNYLQVNTGSFLKFLPTIPTKFVFLHQVIIRYLKMLLFVDHGSTLFWTVLTEGLIGFLCLYFLIISYNKLRFSYWVYFFLSFFIPTLWGNFVGMPRFVIVVFPFFMFLSEWLNTKSRVTKQVYITISVLLLLINFGLYISGIFVG